MCVGRMCNCVQNLSVSVEAHFLSRTPTLCLIRYHINSHNELATDVNVGRQLACSFANMYGTSNNNLKVEGGGADVKQEGKQNVCEAKVVFLMISLLKLRLLK